MIRRLSKHAALVTLLAAALVACGGDDSAAADASVDQTASDAPAQDSAKTDGAPKDASPGDATSDVTPPIDASADAGDDAGEDAAQADATVDAGGCLSNADCANDEFCKKADGDCNGAGACLLIPQFCPQIVAPVCGCDNQTYTNYCYAQKARTSISHSGSCI